MSFIDGINDKAMYRHTTCGVYRPHTLVGRNLSSTGHDPVQGSFNIIASGFSNDRELGDIRFHQTRIYKPQTGVQMGIRKYMQFMPLHEDF
jgi:hypothetical protein